MTHKEIARRARGRVRRARHARQRYRAVGFGLIAVLAMLVFTSTAFDFVQRDRVRVLAGQRSFFYQFPEVQFVIAQAKRGFASGLPSLLKLDSLFPKLRNRKLSVEESRKGDDDDQVVDVKPLDDRRAAPPKRLFLDAIFESGGLTSRDDYPPLQLGVDFSEPFPRHPGGDRKDTGGRTAPIPEPSTGLLMSLGLGILAAVSRNRRSATRRSTDKLITP